MGVTSFDFDSVKSKVEAALRKQLPHDTIDVSPGYEGRAHVLVVSAEFNGMSEEQKQEYVWRILKSELAQDAPAVSFVLVYGTDELRHDVEPD